MKRIILYLHILWLGLKSKLVYRLSSAFELLGKFLEIFAQVIIWVALLGSGSRFDTSLAQMITYLIITRFLTMLVASTAGSEIMDRIRDGSIATDFVRPINLKAYFFCNDIGNNLFKTLVVMLPISVIFMLSYGFLLPETWVQGAAFFLSLCLGTVSMFYYNFLLGLASFWLLTNPFLKWHFRNVEQVFSGLFFPIWFYPDWLASITMFLPFRYFIYEPVAIYLGKTPVSQIGRILLIQAIWALALFGLEHLVWGKAVKKVIVQGG